MNEELTTQLAAASERFAAAAEALERTLARLDEQSGKIDRLVATIDESDATARRTLEDRIGELERANQELKAQAVRAAAQRKTLPPLVTAILAKNGCEPAEKIDAEVLDKTLAALSVEQRIAVKSEMARAGLIE
jgi:ABC-type transporter Mla subunit MlaD